jgi:SAM-dependent methyltransferase
MNHFLRGVVQATAEAFDPPGPVLEIGSYQVAGQQALCDLRPFFAGRPYVGLDRRPGPGVDCIADAECLPQDDGAFGTVLALSAFEHVPRFWRAFAEARRVLRRDGVLLVSVPFYFHVHNHPADYWRFTPQALDLMLEDYPYRVVGWQGPRGKPLHVWAVAFGDDREPPNAWEVETYRFLLRRHAREPLRWHKALRYRLGRWLCGRAPFAPYLDREQWEIECRSQTSPPASVPSPDAQAAA